MPDPPEAGVREIALFIVCIALVLFWPPVLHLGAQHPQSSETDVTIDMRNVHLHVSDDAALDVSWLHGRLHTISPDRPPVFDDQSSFTMEIDDAEVALDAASLTALVNRGFAFKGSNLSDLRVSFEGSNLVQRGKLSKGVTVPFTVTASIATTSEGQLAIHPVKVKAAGIPAAKLMGLFGVELQDLIKGRPEAGISLHENDLLIDPAKLLPPPATRGRVVKAFVRGDRLVQIFGKGAAGRPRSGGNYVWFRGHSIRFGRLTMSNADLKLIDQDPRDPFDFYSAKYNQQLVAGYSKNTPDGALRTYMPDYNDLKR
jgi:hypothetical protein